MKKVILIGGSPTVGKSTMAQALSKKLDLPWISTDQIREMAKTFADPAKYPALFDGGHSEAESFLKAFTPEEIRKMEFDQGKELWPAIVEFIGNDYTWHDGFIVEGVNVIPELVSEYLKGDLKFSVSALFLTDDNEARMEKVIFSRGLWAKADTYPDSLKSIELEWAMLFNRKIKQQCIELNLSYLDVQKNIDIDLKNALKKLGY